MKTFKLLAISFFTVLISSQLYSCPSSTNIKPTPTPTSSLPLFNRIAGNMEALSIITEDFMQNVDKNSTISEKFKVITQDAEKLKSFNKKLTDYLCEVTSGGCKYTNDNSIAPIDLTQAEYDSFKSNLTATLDKFKVLTEDKTQVINLFDPSKSGFINIVNPPSPSPQATASSLVLPSPVPSPSLTPIPSITPSSIPS